MHRIETLTVNNQNNNYCSSLRKVSVCLRVQDVRGIPISVRNSEAGCLSYFFPPGDTSTEDDSDLSADTLAK